MSIDDAISSLWAVVVPTGATDTNLVTNPSFEVGTTGWTTTNATLPRTAGAGSHGAYGARMTASATNGKASFTTAAVSSGASVPFSMYVKADSPLVTLKGTIGASNASQAHPGDGQFHRLSVVITAPSSTTPVLEIIDGRSSAWTAVDIDAAQVETGYSAPTTYLDGDQDGCSWTGTAHGSTATRNGRDSRGGQIVDFATIGLYVTEQQGIGTPPINVATTTYAYTDGSVYTRSLAKERVLTLVAEMLYPTGLISQLHSVRTAVVAAFNLDKRDGRGPIVLRYGGGSSPKRLSAYYEGGLDMDKVEPTTEVASLRFLCSDPFYYAETEAQASLTSSTTTSPVNNVALRSADGTWSNVNGGSAVSASSPIYTALLLSNGMILVGGAFADMGSIGAADRLAIWDKVGWATFGATPNNTVFSLAQAPNGDVYVAGAFTDLAGIANADRIAKWDWNASTYSALSTGADAQVSSICFDPTTNLLWAVGPFSNIGGVAAAGHVAYWNGSAWVNASTGITTTGGGGGDVTIVIGPDGRVYCNGSGGVYVWGGSSWSLLAAANSTYTVQGLKTIDGKLYAYGYFTTIGGISANGIAYWNGAGWFGLGSGIANPGTSYITSIGRMPDGSIVATGYNWSTIGGITPPDTIAIWNGSLWLPFPADPPNSGTHANDAYFVYPFTDGRVLLNWYVLGGLGTLGTSLLAEGITSVTNGGSANAYPVITFTSNGTLYSIRNLTTGQAIYFNGLSIGTGETATLDLRPGKKTFKSFTRDLRSYILAGSDIATFMLAPGTNRLAIYTSNTSGGINLYWRPRYWSAD